MKKANRKLQALIKSGKIDPDDFYVFTIRYRDQGILLQGQKTDAKVKKYTPNGISDGLGWIRQFYKLGSVPLEILLTP